MNKTAIALAASLILSFASEVRAMDVSGVQLPDSINVAGTPLVLNGAGLRTKIMLKLYVLGLYLPAKHSGLSCTMYFGTRKTAASKSC